jgi:hypothetical protein
MRATKGRRSGAWLLAGCSAFAGFAAEAASIAEAPQWEVLVPSGNLGRFVLRVERARFEGTRHGVAAQLADAWSDGPWPILREGDEAGTGLSRLTPSGLESIQLREVETGGVEALRSLLEWRHVPAGPFIANPASGSFPEPSFLASLDALGEPLGSFASRDADTGNVTRAWLVPGAVGVVARDIERAAIRRGLSPVLRFGVPADAPAHLRGGHVLAFGGRGAAAVVTLNPHAAGTAVVVHSQERAP